MRQLEADISLQDWTKHQEIPEVPLIKISKKTKVKQKPMLGQPSHHNDSTIRELFEIENNQNDDDMDLLDGCLLIKS